MPVLMKTNLAVPMQDESLFRDLAGFAVSHNEDWPSELPVD